MSGYIYSQNIEKNEILIVLKSGVEFMFHMG